jgi:hypothetical protein
VLNHRTIPHTDPWSFTAGHGSWVPTAWLSDVLFGLVDKAFGYDGLRVLRVLLALALICTVWLVARRSATRTRDAQVATGLVVLALAPFLRERPQVLGLLFVAWLALAVQRVLAGSMPRILPLVLTSWIWAQVHGLWVLLPVALLGAGVLSWIEDRSRVPLAARCTVIAAASWAIVLATPVGPRLAWWPLVVRRTAAPITEWQPTVLTSLVGVPLLILMAVLVVRWARSDDPVPVTRIMYVLAVVLFGLLAFRNVAPAAILLLPELARGRGNGSEDLPLLPRAGLVAVAGGLVLAAGNLLVAPTVSDEQPLRLVRQLADEHRDLDVLNHYDVGGLITGTASPPLHVAIDGRTDIWSHAFVRDYLNGVAAVDDWRPLVDALEPDAALLLKDSEIARELVRERGWRVIGVQGRWELLEPAAGK